MTRDKFEEAIDKISLDYPFRHTVNYLKDHDAEQRRVIEQLRKELELLKADDAERCTLIRDMEDEERRKDAVIEQLKARLDLVGTDFTANMAYQGQLEKRNADLMQKITTLREALDDIVVRAQRIRETKAVVGVEATFIERVAQQALKEVKE